MDRQLVPPLRKAIAFLEQHGYRYALIGGAALAYWGVVRATYDVDVRVYVPDFDLDRVRNDIQRAFPQRAHLHAPDNAFIVAVNIETSYWRSPAMRATLSSGRFRQISAAGRRGFVLRKI